jgi:hypothetical protein
MKPTNDQLLAIFHRRADPPAGAHARRFGSAPRDSVRAAAPRSGARGHRDPTLQTRVPDVVKRADDEILKAELQEFGRRIRDARDSIAIFL